MIVNDFFDAFPASDEDRWRFMDDDTLGVGPALLRRVLRRPAKDVMSTADPVPQPKYYDPAEVDAYVEDVTKTMKALQARLRDAVRRADLMEHGQRPSADPQADTAGIGRALLLAGEVADRTIADAEARAAEIVRVAEERAAAIVAAARYEAQRLVDTAGNAAAEAYQEGETRLLAAVGAFVKGSNVLRAALAGIENDATGWRRAFTPPTSPTQLATLQPEATPLGAPRTNGGPHELRQLKADTSQR